MRQIKVINPNCNESVTEGLRHSLAGFQNQARIDCVTLTEGPFGIESDADILSVKPLILSHILGASGYDAFIIACYSDPGLDECRRAVTQPVFGIQRSAVETAAVLGDKFGVLALSQESIARHLAYIDKLGFSGQLAGELPLNVTVDEAANDCGTIAKIVRCGRNLIDEYSATTIILGCAGMAAHRETAERDLGVPVIEPVQAAVRQAIAAT